MVDVNHRRDTARGVQADELAALFRPISDFMDCNAPFMRFVTDRFVAMAVPAATLTVRQCSELLTQWNEDYNRLATEQGRLWVDDSQALGHVTLGELIAAFEPATST